MEIVTAIITALIGLLAYFSARAARVAAEHSSSAADTIANESLAVQKAQLVLEYQREVREWTVSVIRNTDELIALSKLDPARTDINYRTRQVFCVARISTDIDSGRCFFNNDTSIPHGQEKEEAFRGFRHKVLDPLVRISLIGKKLDYLDCNKNKGLDKEIVKQKRDFVSNVQKYIRSPDWLEIVDSAEKNRDQIQE
ncbi:hypothetical protein [Arenicella xantha]|uniref:DUF4760 domain-containing protein n=1 Tax=Arenicella xantha TaxID=644221 RepID=A0A395JMR4_9GAMM|nr:hypothetical protein [Arenicella xantha]RBP51725.1 hypothetical protein DFR28_1021158 [Arenicella xantha]